MTTTKKERLQAAISKERADRLPVALWRHFPVDDQSPEELATSLASFQSAYDFDFIKVTPASSYCLVDWGVRDEWRGNLEGTRTYVKRVIESPQDWGTLKLLDPESGALKRQLTCLEMLRDRIGPDVPIIETIFSPLSQAKNLAGEDRFFEHLRREPGLVMEGLKTITDTSIAFIEACKMRGIDGIFYAVQHASYRYFDLDGYREMGGRWDRKVFERVEDLWLNVLHLHGEAIIFEAVEEFPAQVVNWHDRESEISLADGLKRVVGAVCGGVRRETLSLGEPAEIRAEAEGAIDSVSKAGLILSTGCVAPIVTPRANLQTLRDSVD